MKTLNNYIQERLTTNKDFISSIKNYHELINVINQKLEECKKTHNTILDLNDIDVSLLDSNFTKTLFSEPHTDGEFANLNKFDIKEVDISSWNIDNIGEAMFEGCFKLEKITIPDTVTNIYSNAFNWCENLKSINIPKNLETIWAYAFSSTDSLEAIYIYDLTKWCQVDLKDSLRHQIDFYLNDKKLENLVIPESIKVINSEVFYNCKSIVNVFLHNKVHTIKDSAFQNCTKLQTINIPNSVKTIEWDAFKGCNNLKYVYVEDPSHTKKIKYSNIEANPLNLFGVSMKLQSERDVIKESLTQRQVEIVGDVVLSMLKGSKLTSEQLTNMFMSLSIDYIKKIEDYVKTIDKENSIAYIADNDEFLIESNKKNIVDKFVKYLSTFIVNL